MSDWGEGVNPAPQVLLPEAGRCAAILSVEWQLGLSAGIWVRKSPHLTLLSKKVLKWIRGRLLYSDNFAMGGAFVSFTFDYRLCLLHPSDVSFYDFILIY